MMNTVKFSSAVSVDKGRVRGNNEDNFFFNGQHLTAENRDDSSLLKEETSEPLLVYGVFDGMGGEALGEEASLIAASVLKDYAERAKLAPDKDAKVAILRAIREANSQICQLIVARGEKRIGTTYAAVYIQDDIARVVNVGDSRVYLWRKGVLRQISVDDTSVQRMIELGVVPAEEAKNHASAHKLTQHLGIFPEEMEIEPHISEEIKIQKGDSLLLCSDGLTDMLEDDVISSILQQSTSSEQGVKKLVSAALSCGGKDNTTALLITAKSGPKSQQKKIDKTKVIAGLAVLALIAGVGLHFAGQPKQADGEILTNIDNTEEIEELPEPTDVFIANLGDGTLPVGAKNTFLVQIKPTGARAKPTFTSSDSSVLLVGQDSGTYEALKEGFVTVTVTVEDVERSEDLVVYEPIEDIILPNQIWLTVGEIKAISYEIIPEGVNAIPWMTSSDESVFWIDETGAVVAESPGTATLYANYYGSTGAMTTVTVQDVPSIAGNVGELIGSKRQGQ